MKGDSGFPFILHPSSFILLLTLLFTLHPASLLSSPADSRVQFVEVASQAGLTFKHENGASAEKLMPETFGSGVAWIDYDNDGWIDLFFANGADLARSKASPGNALFRNLGNGKFANVTERAGVKGGGLFATGAAVGDYDNDGFQDLFVTGYGGVQLLHNNGDGTFADVSQKAGVAASGWSSSTGWLDYNRDGFLDLYVVRYLDYDIKNAPYCGFRRDGYRMYCDPQQFDGVPDLLFRNNHDGTFTDVSRQAGISNRSGKGLGVSLGDVDKDGLTDIFVTNDGIRNFLYRNKGDGTFGDVAYEACVGFDTHGKPMAGMGTEIADYDEDGNPDIFMTAFSREYNTLFRNLGKLIFEDVTATVGIESGFLTLAFGAKLFDYDNDGDLDIYATNGHVTDNVELYDGELSYRQKDLLYENTNGSFVDISSQSGPAFQVKHVGRGAAIGDFDNDGDLDIVVADCGGPPLLMRNDGGNRNNWIGIQARGKESNRFGIGAKVRVTSAGRTRLREINIAGSYLSSSDVRLFFGLGSETKAERVEIEWPSRKKQTLENVPARQILQLDESNAK